MIIAEKDDASKTEIYTVNSDAKIYINNSVSAFDDLKKNMEVSLTLTDGKVSKVVVGSLGTDFSGTLKKIEYMNGYYLVTATRDSDNSTKEYYTSNALKQATLNGAAVDPVKLTEGDNLKLRFNDKNQIIEMIATSKSRKIEGILKSQSLFNGKPQIVVRTEGTTEVAVELGTNMTLRRNDKYAELSEILPGDYVVVRISYDKVSGIEAYSSSTAKKKGTIEQIVIGRTNKLTIKDDDGAIKEYDVSPTVIIRLEGSSSDIYAMRMNYRVELEVQGSTLVKVDATKVSFKDQVSGRVSKVYRDLGIVTLRSTTGATDQYISVSVNGNTQIITASGSTRTIGSLEEGKSIFVSGHYYDSFFLAEKIIMLD